MSAFQQLVNAQIDASGLLASQQNADVPGRDDMEVSKEYNIAMPPTQHPPPKPKLIITEQPHPKLHRFRYLSEQRGSTAGSILGVRTTADRPTYPAIQILNCNCPVKVIVSCLSTDEAPRLHPYRLVGRPDCRHGVCVIRIGPETGMTCSINNLAVQSVLKKQVEKELEERQRHYRSPYNVPLGDVATIDLKKVRLCFELYLETSPGNFVVVNPPALSDVIYDRKYIPDLVINEMSHCQAPVTGGKQIMILTDTVSKEDIRVRFLEERKKGSWIAYGTVKRVHKHVAIVLDTPAYDDLEITTSVIVQVQLERTSDMDFSKPLSFELHPVHNRIPKQELATPAPQPTPGPSYHKPKDESYHKPKDEPDLTSILSLEEFLRQPIDYSNLPQFNQILSNFATGNATPNAPVTDSESQLPQFSSLENFLLGLPPVQEIDPRIPNLQQYDQQLDNFVAPAVGNTERNAPPVTEQEIENLSYEMLDITVKDLTDL